MDSAVGKLNEKAALLAGVNITRRGSLALIAGEDAFKFLAGCEALELKVLGVEGFSVSDASLTPIMDAIADFSAIDYWRDSIVESIAFIELVKNGKYNNLMFDITLSNE